ncbi:MAG: hypothetical protein COU43_01675 [Candidatus Nealsonbacteria bacterium CG10_big_fil_rev_8_21_14_0_10_37_25]|uniref:Cation-transporting P-type ATPase C-terminal domain-containing protein n=2 Tax=Patescibacteria group TaxID=1783273 RepID=A0A2M8EV24_9BACT|nr:MAG: hypothetical protein COU43_01675 [Candidatus Nealsonbacteria bacterium CG10_big_fil_rev_8_21_14_0_10_37_25]PJC28972.1 MAG: hypothetical protein CO053_01805 [Candidatus Shapirobacteria bacterium CG_4_9_14_0_2_um_filter_40_11]
MNPFSNKFLIFAWLIGFAAFFAALYLPVFQTLLKTVPLGLSDWLILIGLGIIEIILIEATKWYFIAKKPLEAPEK